MNNHYWLILVASKLVHPCVWTKLWSGTTD